MLFLIASLLAGLYFLISGKVKIGNTVYLEGTKARTAGLIFLAPLGSILVILAAVFILGFIRQVEISETSRQIIDDFSSALVRNGFMIGLAYINFYSVSRGTKERGGCLIYWLAYAAITALLLIYFLPNLVSNTQFFESALIGISIFQIIFLIGIWLWKKWGVFGYAAITLISPIVAFLGKESFSEVVINLITSLSLIFVLYLLAKPKWRFFE